MEKLQQLFLLIVVFGSAFISSAANAKLIEVQDTGAPTENWTPVHPQMILAFSFSESPEVQKYAAQFNQISIDQKVKKIVRYNVSSVDVINDLKDPNTVAYVFVGHTYKDKVMNSSILLDHSMHPLPVNFISSATPSLRVLGLFGCHGPEILPAYQAQYEIGKIPGVQKVYVPSFKLLLTNRSKLLPDRLGRTLRELTPHLQELQLNQGTQIQNEFTKLTISVKDVRAKLETRFVSVNGSIVGTLGSGSTDSNEGSEWKDLTYSVPIRILKKDKSQNIKIVGPEQSTGAVIDDYLISKISFPELALEKNYEPPKHIGDNEVALNGNLTEAEFSFQAKSAKNMTDLSQLIANYEWMSLDTVWPAISARFYRESL